MKIVTDLSVTAMLAPGRRAWHPGRLFNGGAQGAWFDPMDAASVFTDVAGTILAAPGDAVAHMADKSGNGHHAVQAAPAARPLLRQDPEGRRYLEFDGIDDHLLTASLDMTATQRATAVAGLRKLSSDHARVVLGHNVPSVSPGGFDLLTSTGANAFVSVLARSTSGSTSQCGVTQWRTPPISLVVTGRMDFSAPAGEEVQLRIDSEEFAQTIGTGTENNGTFGNGPLSIGARPNATAFHQGHLHGALVCGRDLSAVELSNLETWMIERAPDAV